MCTCSKWTFGPLISPFIKAIELPPWLPDLDVTPRCRPVVAVVLAGSDVAPADAVSLEAGDRRELALAPVRLAVCAAHREQLAGIYL